MWLIRVGKEEKEKNSALPPPHPIMPKDRRKDMWAVIFGGRKNRLME